MTYTPNTRRLNMPDRVCDGDRHIPGTDVEIVTLPPHGCYACCSTCDLDEHKCPGCGTPLNHGVNVCLRCRNDLDTHGELRR